MANTKLSLRILGTLYKRTAIATHIRQLRERRATDLVLVYVRTAVQGELADETVRAAVVTPVTSGLVGLLGPVKFDPCPEIESEALARLVGW